MEMLYERLLKLPVIRSKVTAEHFVQVCTSEDWSHFLGFDPANQINDYAFEHRKIINTTVKLELKAFNQQNF
jgi:hypothetical protein